MRELLRLNRQNVKNAQSGELFWKRAVKIIVIFSFAAGILLANLMGREKTAGIGILNDYFMEQFKYGSINREDLFFYIIGERLPMVLLLLLLAFSSLGIALGAMNLAWQGFSVGFMLSAAAAKYGAGGILLILGGMFPQYIFYIVVYIAVFGLAICLHRRLQNIIHTGTISRQQIRIYGIGALAGVVLLLLFVTGIFLESYLNPIFLKKILKIF